MAREKPQPELRQASEQWPTVRAALAQLLEADQLARSVRRSPAEFAIELPSLILAGSSAAALKWLVAGNLALHLAASNELSDRATPTTKLVFSDDSRFAITEKGIDLARTIPEISHITSTAKMPSPQWTKRDRELWYTGKLVLRLTPRATNQLLILSAFQEQRWCELIDDPLLLVDTDPQKRLLNTLYRLNEGQIERLLDFTADGGGKGVRWKPRVLSSQ